MATIDATSRPRFVSCPGCCADVFADSVHRDTLPSISHLDLETIKSERNDLSRFSVGNGLNISTAPLASPTVSMYSGPPPPYSCALPTAVSAPGLSGYISPPESTTRRSIRDEKDSPDLRKSLPSIHEALADKSMPFPANLPGASQHQSLSMPSTAAAPSFSEGPKGPLNPFSQPPGVPVLREVFSGPPMPALTHTDVRTSQPAFPQVSAPDPRQQVSHHFGYPGSPRPQQSSTFHSSSLTNTSFISPNELSQAKSPRISEPSRQHIPFPALSSTSSSSFPPTSEPFQFSAGPKPEAQRESFAKPSTEQQYSDTVKRHLEVFDAELGLNEVRST